MILVPIILLQGAEYWIEGEGGGACVVVLYFF